MGAALSALRRPALQPADEATMNPICSSMIVQGITTAQQRSRRVRSLVVGSSPHTRAVVQEPPFSSVTTTGMSAKCCAYFALATRKLERGVGFKAPCERSSTNPSVPWTGRGLS